MGLVLISMRHNIAYHLTFIWPHHMEEVLVMMAAAIGYQTSYLPSCNQTTHHPEKVTCTPSIEGGGFDNDKSLLLWYLPLPITLVWCSRRYLVLIPTPKDQVAWRSTQLFLL